MSDTLAARLQFPLFLDDRPETAQLVAEILTRPCFHRLARVCAEVGTRWTKHKKLTASVIADYLLDRRHRGVILDSGRGSEVGAMGVAPNGQHERNYEPLVTVLIAYVYIPLELDRVAEAVAAFCDLAVALDARSGAVSAEPDGSTGQDFGLAWPPKPRPDFTDRRWLERRARQQYADDIATQLGGPEWGLFLGAGHLDRVAPAALRASGAFEQVVELTPSLVFLQLTADPADALAGEPFDRKLAQARAALAPILMDVSTVRRD